MGVIMTKICTNCKQENEDDSKFCIKCGENFDKYKSSQINSKKFKKKNSFNLSNKQIGIIVGFGIILMIIIFSVSIGQSNTNTHETSIDNETDSASNISESPKTYKDEYFSFDYPGDFAVENSDGYLAIQGPFTFMEISNFTADDSLSETKNTIENVDTYYLDLQNSEYITVDGVKAYQYKRYNSLEKKYELGTIFIKNGNEYRIYYYATNLNLNELNIILKSFKTSK